MQAVADWPIPIVFERLSGARLKGALIAGAGRVLSRRDDLNRINVFPVPDGDTGTNLAFTMLAVLKTVRPASISNETRGDVTEACPGATRRAGPFPSETDGPRRAARAAR